MDLRTLFVEEHDDLYRYLVRYTGDEALAADAMQEAFLAALERPPKRPGNVRSWLYVVATNAARQTLRNMARQRRLLDVHADAVPHGSRSAEPDERVVSNEARDRVRAALQQLSERDRAVLLMWDLGMKQREIAEAVSVAPGSVGTLLARSLKRLATLCEGQNES